MKSVNDAHAWLEKVKRGSPDILRAEGAVVVEALLVSLDAAHQKDLALTQGVLTAVTDAANRKRAFREIRARKAEPDFPLHLAADIEQILCETGKDFGDER